MIEVAVRRCENYQQETVQIAVDQLLQDIKAEELFKPQDKVLLKVNLLSAKTPEKAVTTHPAFVSALTRWFVQRGAEVWVGDSSGGIAVTGSNTARALETTGVEAAAKEAGAKVLNFDTTGSTPVSGGRELKSVLVAKPVLEADLVVSVPKLKTHGLTLFTGGVKNMFGVVPGAAKAEYHRTLPTLKRFAQGLVDVFAASKPHLTVMDGILAMEGNGPAAGTPRELGLVLASRDAVALDAAACKLIGCPPERVLTTVLASAADLGSMSPRLIGDAVTPVQFKLPPSAIAGAVAPRISSALLGLLAHIPEFDPQTCTNCNICVTSCPVDALAKGEGNPILDPVACIHCFCCHELCPRHAIDLVPRYPRSHRVMSWLLPRRRKTK